MLQEILPFPHEFPSAPPARYGRKITSMPPISVPHTFIRRPLTSSYFLALLLALPGNSHEYYELFLYMQIPYKTICMCPARRTVVLILVDSKQTYNRQKKLISIMSLSNCQEFSHSICMYVHKYTKRLGMRLDAWYSSNSGRRLVNTRRLA